MAKFTPGDLCVIVDSHAHPENIGRECEFIDYLDESIVCGDVVSDCVINIPNAPTDTHPNGWWLANSRHLRKKKPPETLGSWDAIEKITKWNPTKVKA